MTGARIALAAAFGVLAGACMDPGDFRCTQHAQCTVGNVAGACEADGHCSVPDELGCPLSHRRYAHRAGAASDLCVPRSCGGNALTQVSAGGGHACLVREDGSVWCWGRNDHGQLGDGTRTPRALPVRVSGISGVTAIAAGDAHTCAVMASAGLVMCWGAGSAGQLGDGGNDDQGLPQVVPGVTNPAGVTAGKDFSCAVGADRSVTCWGDDSVGQLGDGGGAGGPRGPVAVAGVAQVRALSATWQHACAVGDSGSLICWGANDQGQIGDGAVGGARAPTDVTALPRAALPRTVGAVVTGHAHTCALAGDGLRCWGANDQGQVSPGDPNTALPSPQDVKGVNVSDPIDVAAGAQHTCIIRPGDRTHVTCWGRRDEGQLGGTTIGNTLELDAVKLVAGAAFTCAIARDDALYCWGDNHFGQLAIGGDRLRTTPVQVPGIAHAGALATGGAHTCATADDPNTGRALYCWGANGSSQLGDGDAQDAPTATRTSSLAPDAIAAGGAHTCAYASDRELRCWGAGADGQLGLSPGTDGVVTIPTVTDLAPPLGGDGVVAVAAGAAHTCVSAAVSASVLCFGLDSDGQLGHPPLAVKATALAAGDAHSCALDEDGAVWCWGRGDEGQLGDGSGMAHATGAKVTLASDVTKAAAIAAGAAHACALAEGRIFCWGRNAEGQVGTPVQIPIVLPREVTKPWAASAIAAGGNHTCAIDGDGSVRCWGANESGQLGNGTVDSSNVPVLVTGLTSVDAIAAGGAHSCARRTDGTVWCWGSNTSGQLGDGVPLTSVPPLLARVACP